MADKSPRHVEGPAEILLVCGPETRCARGRKSVQCRLMHDGLCAIGNEFDREKSRQLRFAIVLTAVVLVGEVVGGIWTGSLALLSDAGHVLSDVMSLALSLFAIRLASRPPTGRLTYGLHRAEVFAALLNGLALLGICFLIFREAFARFGAPPEIKSVELLVFALVGLAANWLILVRLGGHSHDDINLRSAYLHVLGDLLASVGVVISALVIMFTRWTIADPIASMVIGLVILVGAGRVTAEAMHILLEGVPRGVDLEQVADALMDVPQVESVHGIHAWSICSNLLAFSAHVVMCPETEEERAEVVCELEHTLAERFGFYHTTLQAECEPCDHQSLVRRLQHRDSAATPHNHNHNHSDHTE